MPAGFLSYIRRSFPVIYKGSTGSLAGSFTPVTLKGLLIFSLMSVSYRCPLNYRWIFFIGLPGGFLCSFNQLPIFPEDTYFLGICLALRNPL